MSSMEEVITNCDLLTKILLRLPAKSLIRFKSVSKHWHSIITDARFGTLHKPDLNYVSGLFFNEPVCYGLLRWNEYTDTLNPSLNFIPVDKSSTDVSHVESIELIPKISGMKILNSCNGLLLCSGYIEDENIGGYCVINPTTKQFETLPDLHLDPQLDQLKGLGLAYDPSRSHHFKVVCISSFPGTSRDTFQIEVYSSETKTWKASGQRFTINALRMYLSSGVYWNGAINWLNSAAEPLYFLVDEERVGFMPLLPTPPDNIWYIQYYFGESRGHLHFVEFYDRTTQFNVFEMKRDYSEWFVKYRVDLAAITTEFPEMTVLGWNCQCWYSVTYILRGKDNDGGSYMVLYIPGKFLRYNFVDGSYEIICEYKDSHTIREDGHLLTAYPYIESLCPLTCCQKHSPTLPC